MSVFDNKPFDINCSQVGMLQPVNDVRKAALRGIDRLRGELNSVWVCREIMFCRGFLCSWRDEVTLEERGQKPNLLHFFFPECSVLGADD